MARKFGKKNVVKVNPLAYNIGILGESGIGKTSLIIDVCEKLVGEDGYMLLNIGREKGVDTIQGAVYEDVKSWTKYYEVINEFVGNKEEDYKELKVVIIDTIDELSKLAEKEVIRLHNVKNPSKKTDGINSAFGGFGAGQDMVSELILKSIDDLREVGINVIIVGHTKRRSKTDVITGEEYDVITAKITDRLFTDIKTKLDILGMGIIKREIKEDVIGKDIMGNDKVYKNTKSANRVLAFRSEGYALDSKSRFAGITDEIEFDSDIFIKTIKDAIELAYNAKDIGKTIEEAEKEQEQEKQSQVTEVLEELKIKNAIQEKYGTKDEMIDKIKTNFMGATDEIKTSVKEKLKEIGVSKFDSLIDHEYDVILSVIEIF